MANFVFETMSQADAATFTSNDNLLFITSGTNARNIGVALSAGNQLTNAGIVLTVGTKSLTFSQMELSSASLNDKLVFNDTSHLLLGTQNSDTIASQVQIVFNDISDGPSTKLAPGPIFLPGPNPTHPDATDVIYGFGGNDTLGDSVAGAAGNNDYVYGGAGNDNIYGGAGNDHLYGFGPVVNTTDGDDNIQAGAGSDYLQGNGGNDILNGGDGEDRIFGGAGDDNIFGGNGLDTINGNLGNDTISGGDGNDFIRGGQGNDSIMGDTGNDQIMGDLGSDTIRGGAGIDVLTGGADADVFGFSAGDASYATAAGSEFRFFTDSVTDFQDGVDKIELPFAVDTVVTGPGGAVFTGFEAAQTYAQQLLDAAAGTDDLAAVQVNGDTYLFFNDTGTSDAINAAIKFNGLLPGVFNSGTGSDFIVGTNQQASPD